MLLISVELASAVLLLVGGGLMTRSLVAIDRAPLGFDPDGLLTLNAPDPRVATDATAAPTEDGRAQTLLRMRAPLAQLPGVTYAGLVDTPRRLVQQVMQEALGWIAAGVLAGAAGALLLTRSLRSVLYEVTATDPLTFAGMMLLMSSVAMLACYLPARRGSRIAPVDAIVERG